MMDEFSMLSSSRWRACTHRMLNEVVVKVEPVDSRVCGRRTDLPPHSLAHGVPKAVALGGFAYSTFAPPIGRGRLEAHARHCDDPETKMDRVRSLC